MIAAAAAERSAPSVQLSVQSVFQRARKPNACPAPALP